MAMFDDPKKELKNLEEQLLKEEEWLDKELASAKALIGDASTKKPQKAAPAKRSMEETQVYRRTASAQPQSGDDTKFRSASAPVRNFANDYGDAPKTVVRNTEGYDLDLDDDSVGAASKGKRGKGESVKGLVILAALETLGIVGIVAYWLIFLL